MIASIVARAGSAAALATVLLCSLPPTVASAQSQSNSAAQMEARISALIPALEAYIQRGMKAFDVPGLAIGLVTGDRLVYAKGFGVRSKSGGVPVDTRTDFQIGSLAKAFLTTTMAIMVDRGKLKWDDRVVDLHPGFQLEDAWVTREFRAFDLPAQRSGLPPYVNDVLGSLGYAEPALIRSLRHVEPVSSFRSTYAYTNITHLLAGRIVSDLAGAPDWNAVARRELLDPLGMTETSFTAEAIAAAANHAEGYRWTLDGTIAVPFHPFAPYATGPAGNINSTIEEMARWVRLQLGLGSFEGRRIVSVESLAYTRRPKVALDDKSSYAMGWLQTRTPNGTIVWHDGGTDGFGSFLGLLPERDVGLIMLSSEGNVGLPDALGMWSLDRLLDNPVVDHVADALKHAKAKLASEEKTFAKPASPRPFPALAPLAGSFESAALGKAVLRGDGAALVLELQETGAELALTPWDGEIFTLRLLPRGRFAPVVASGNEQAFGFAQFEIGQDGKLSVLRLTLGDGQRYDFRRQHSQ